ncbi:MAG: hypothetical protein J5I52_03445 [Saprospiraceae bacterium]|nr:MAG: hypothetical protein UZ09_BCD002002496 [Bacteroidetes bacterium OLB9]MCO6463183.1 hypothetical protein [Saprospiraceae bacterium]MCZ2338738.1 hypothetical protein [Chitinophagales bacterium]
MNYYIDFLALNQVFSKKVRIGLGIIIIIDLTLMIVNANYSPPIINWITRGILIIMLLIVIMNDFFNYNIAKLFGKAFIDINENAISMKPSILTKEQKVVWSNVESLRYDNNRLKFLLKNGKPSTIDLSKLEYKIKNDIKDAVRTIANKKNISAVI